MNKIVLTLLGAAALAAALPAFAGPDWNVIERGRAAAQQAQQTKPCTQQSNDATAPSARPSAG